MAWLPASYIPSFYLTSKEVCVEAWQFSEFLLSCDQNGEGTNSVLPEGFISITGHQGPDLLCVCMCACVCAQGTCSFQNPVLGGAPAPGVPSCHQNGYPICANHLPPAASSDTCLLVLPSPTFRAVVRQGIPGKNPGVWTLSR